MPGVPIKTCCSRSCLLYTDHIRHVSISIALAIVQSYTKPSKSCYVSILDRCYNNFIHALN